MTEAEDRIAPLDVARGAAIIGVVLMNVAAIALPRSLNILPTAGNGGVADALVWLAGFILVDGKARALLAMLFGASTLLVIDRAEMDGRDGVAAQRQRLLWLLPIGIAHYALVWSGDILMLLAVGGLIALRFVGHEPMELVKAAFLFFAAQLLIVLFFTVTAYWASSPADYHGLLQREMVLDIALHRDGYGAIALERIKDFPQAASLLSLHALPETLGFMMLGMAMAKGGFFFGQWTVEQYRQTARRAYLVGIPPMLALGLWAMATDDPRTIDMIGYAAAFPFRIPLTIGHAALLVVAAQAAVSAPLARVAAVGRLALSNYLLCSLVMTGIAYGYGAGLYAHIGRLGLLALSAGLLIAMLLWSPLWLAKFGQGPAERLWRTMQRRG
ncbi:DUF418 domain-containing protein [Sphingobium sufflavum]|uniref:DUF418 domain-containing protein n=1 Tax=Sphingobium sufflavum TaxID=1129547 RepID=UPI001F22ACF0|nr:DUF418 domain-containing protein [Sphingobium sufflavum]MCE7795496.1 DUF418 domain-containing protein [Sphingobium sufflavum]